MTSIGIGIGIGIGTQKLWPLDAHGNFTAREGCDRCACGCKYWENDCCVDCGEHVSRIPPTHHQTYTVPAPTPNDPKRFTGRCHQCDFQVTGTQQQTWDSRAVHEAVQSGLVAEYWSTR